jgi:hypothetical protein
MNKLFHVIYAVITFYASLVIIATLESGDFGAIHIASAFFLGGGAAIQIFTLVEEALDIVNN